MSEVVLPCPHCGKHFWTVAKDPVSTALVVRCGSCRASGSPKITRDLAIAAWNRRAPVDIGITAAGATALGDGEGGT